MLKMYVMVVTVILDPETLDKKKTIDENLVELFEKEGMGAQITRIKEIEAQEKV
jgi:hypothetical protein